MKIAAVQMVSTPELERNLDTARRLVGEARAAGAALVALPEYFCFMGRADTDKLALAEPGAAPGAPPGGPIQRALAAMAREHGVWLIGGTLPLQRGAGAAAADAADDRRAFNSCCVYAPDGTLAARYDKRHLFRFDDGERRYDEAETLRHGDDPVALDIDAGARWRVGLSVCYDLRFPEHYRALMTPPCDLLAVPSAFTHVTGQAHWELLLRARAVENQCYVVAPAQGGRHPNGRRTWGHSMIVDPWGEVLALRADEGAGIVVAELDAARLAAVRRQLPALEHRR